MKNLVQAIHLAFKNIRSRIFHTFLSVLGIIIGVGALVSMLSLINGLEKFAKDQIDKTTGLNAALVFSKTGKEVNGVQIARDSVEYITYDDLEVAVDDIDGIANYLMTVEWSDELTYEEDTIASEIRAEIRYDKVKEEKAEEENILLAGAFPTFEMAKERQAYVVINNSFKKLTKDSLTSAEDCLGKTVSVEGQDFKVVAIAKGKETDPPTILLPLSTVNSEVISKKGPVVFLRADDVEKLTDLKDNFETWVSEKRPHLADDIDVNVDMFRLDQLEQGFLIFRIVMGLIVGISVVVGGVGVMNVMLITVKERTPEIGIRKAIGAKRREIRTQFLVESVVISFLGSLLGFLFAVLFNAIAVPLINHFVERSGNLEVPLEAVYTFSTMATIAVIAILIGILFGTYPAIRASKLDPVAAINRV